MDCETCENRLLELLYEELSASDAKAVRAHVDGCVRCASSLRALEGTLEQVRAVPPLEPSDAGVESLLAYAAQAAARSRPPARSSWLRFLFRPVIVVPAIAGVAGALALFGAELGGGGASAPSWAMGKVDGGEREQVAAKHASPAKRVGVAQPAPAGLVEEEGSSVAQGKDLAHGSDPKRAASPRPLADEAPLGASEKKRDDRAGVNGDAPARRSAPLDSAGELRPRARAPVGAARGGKGAAMKGVSEGELELDRADLAADAPPTVGAAAPTSAAPKTERPVERSSSPQAAAPPAAARKEKRAEAAAESGAAPVPTDAHATFNAARELEASNVPVAIALYLRVVEQHPRSQYAPLALRSAARLERARLDEPAARRLEERLAREYPDAVAP